MAVGSRKDDLKLRESALEAAKAEVMKAQHTVAGSGRLVMTADALTGEVNALLERDDDVLLVVGGTGVGRADFAVETLKPLYEKELVGFGELVRRLGMDRLGLAAVSLRSSAGVARGKLIVCLPDSAFIVRAVLRAFVGEFPHIIFVARKGLRG